MTTREIYKAAISLFRTACTTYQNLWHGDPSTRREDVEHIVNRCIKANEWCKAHDLGIDYRYACSNVTCSPIGGIAVLNSKVFAAVFNGESIF